LRLIPHRGLVLGNVDLLEREGRVSDVPVGLTALGGGQEMLVGVTSKRTAVVPRHGKGSTHASLNRAGRVEDSAPSSLSVAVATGQARTGTRRRASSPRAAPSATPAMTSEAW